MIAGIASALLLSIGGTQETAALKLAQVWGSYRYAEFDAMGGYNCDKRQHRYIVSRFKKRFGLRVALLRKAAARKLGRAFDDDGFDVIALCSKVDPAKFKTSSWEATYFNRYEVELASAEEAFGIRGMR